MRGCGAEMSEAGRHDHPGQCRLAPRIGQAAAQRRPPASGHERLHPDWRPHANDIVLLPSTKPIRHEGREAAAPERWGGALGLGNGGTCGGSVSDVGRRTHLLRGKAGDTRKGDTGRSAEVRGRVLRSSHASTLAIASRAHLRSRAGANTIGPYIIARTREAVDTEVSRLRAMSWDAFREFARSSERRHYVLD